MFPAYASKGRLVAGRGRVYRKGVPLQPRGVYRRPTPTPM